jgi:hypothetical protein
MNSVRDGNAGRRVCHGAVTKARKITPAERLEFHQQHSQTLMEGLRVEPNSGLSKAIAHLFKVCSKFLSVSLADRYAQARNA